MSPAALACSALIWCCPSNALVVQGSDLPTASAKEAQVKPFFMRLNTMVSVTSFRVNGPACTANARLACTDRTGAATARRNDRAFEPRIATRAVAGATAVGTAKDDMLWGGWELGVVRCGR